jgi:hypothetical protein
VLTSAIRQSALAIAWLPGRPRKPDRRCQCWSSLSRAASRSRLR